MPEISFHDNYTDLSEGQGFQFEFYCERCHDAWRTEFSRYMAGTARDLLGTASSLLGGLFGGAERVADQVSDARYRAAHDKAFAQAIEQAKAHFHRCRRCSQYVCAQCFNPNLNLCANCAPSVEDEANVAARDAEIDVARTKAEEAVRSGKRVTDGNVVCAACGARVQPAKFCSECGSPMTQEHKCAQCGAEIAPGVRFCPECGAKQ